MILFLHSRGAVIKPSSFIVACRSLGWLSAALYVMSLLVPAFVVSGYSYFGFGVLFDGMLGVLFGYRVNWPWLPIWRCSRPGCS